MVFPPANLLVPAAPGSLRPIAPPLKCRRGLAGIAVRNWGQRNSSGIRSAGFGVKVDFFTVEFRRSN
jgi:hypothetical protein